MATPEKKDIKKREAGAATPAPRNHAANGHNADTTITADPLAVLRDSPAPVGRVESVPKLRMLDVARMVSQDPPPVPWRIEGLAIDGTLGLLAGREGQGKSLLAQSLAAGVAAGETIAGFKCHRGKVLIVDAENGEHEIHRRVRSLDLPATGVQVCEATGGFHLGNDLAELAALLTEHRPNLLILDSFRSLWPGGDENDTAQTAGVLYPLQSMIRDLGIATILLHHAGKNGHEYRGSTAIGAAVEVGFTLSRKSGDPERKTRRVLDNWKCRPAPEPDPHWLSLSVERDRVYIDQAEPFTTPGEPSEPVAPARAELAPQMLEAVRQAESREEPITTLAGLARAIDKDPKDGTVRRLRNDLIRSGEMIERDGAFHTGEGAKSAEGANPVAPPANLAIKPKVKRCHGATPLKGPSEVGTSHDRPKVPPGMKPRRPVDPAVVQLDHAEALIEKTFGPVERIGETA